MSKFFLRFLAGFMVFMISCLALADSDKKPNTWAVQSEMTSTQEMTNLNRWVLKCGNVPMLMFRGIPNETQTGEITYAITSKSGFKRMLVKITGSAFADGESSLDTEYQPGGAQSWCKAGESFIMQVASGAINIIKFRATTGPIISSQHAGSYTVKLSFIVISDSK